MHAQIAAAVGFLVCLIKHSEHFKREQLDLFQHIMTEMLMEKFKNHWYPEKPDKGNAYRCIRINKVNRGDKILESSINASGIHYEDFISRLPRELTIWIDPNEVCYRIGENRGSVCTLISFSTNGYNRNINDRQDPLSEDSVVGSLTSSFSTNDERIE